MAWIGHFHVPQCKTDANITTLGTAMPTPTDAGLNMDNQTATICHLHVKKNQMETVEC
jgi:hypothetical protein